MRKGFKTYLAIWVLFFVIFNLVIFVIPSSIDGKTIIEIVKVVSAIRGGDLSELDIQLLQLADYLMNGSDTEMILYKYGGAFWPGYVCVICAFIGQLAMSFYAFKETNNQRFFYKIPLITISYIGLILTLFTGVVMMFFPDFPIWLGICVCAIIAVFTLLSLIRANATAEIISSKDEEIQTSTSFYRDIIDRLEILRRSVNDPDKEESIKEVYDCLRYSDPKKVEEHKIEIERYVKEIEMLTNDNKPFSSLIDDLYKLIR